MPNIIGADSAGNYEITASRTDTTIGRVTKVGDFGLGSATFLTSGDLATFVEGKYVVTSAVLNLPIGGTSFNIDVTSANGLPSKTFYANEINTTNLWVGTNSSGGAITWSEVWTTDNLNTNEFGGVGGASRIIGVAYAVNATQAIVTFPISSFTLPVSVSSVSTFELIDLDFSASYPVGAISLSASTSEKLCIVDLSGVTGLTTGNAYYLRKATATSKITVNF